MIYYNIRSIGKTRSDFCTILDKDRSVIVTPLKTLIMDSKRRFWLPKNTTIEAKMLQKDKSLSLGFAVRKNNSDAEKIQE